MSRIKIYVLTISLISFILLLVFGMADLNNEESLIPSRTKNITTIEGVKSYIKEDSVTNTRVVFILENNTDEQYLYGQFFAIEKLVDGEWYEIPYLNDEQAWSLVGYSLKPHEVKEEEVDWKEIYGVLRKGEYRIIKKMRKSETTDKISKDKNLQEYDLVAYFEI